MSIYRQDENGNYQPAEPMDWQDAGVEWEIYTNRPIGAKYIAEAFRMGRELKRVQGNNKLWFNIRVNVWNRYLKIRER